MRSVEDNESSTLELGEVVTDLLPQPVEYAALIPSGDTAGRFVYLLHGGGGSRDFLNQARPWVEAAWASGTLPPCVVATPSVTRSFYMNFRDGSHRWEDALLGPLVEHFRTRYSISTSREHTALTGPSMGGMGSLRMAFKYPERFVGVAALEPGIEPALAFEDIELQDRFWRSDELFRSIYGDPVDSEYWTANNPANIALANLSRLRDSGLAIYLEVGDQDCFGLDRGTEFLHRLLYDNHVSHEYRLVRGADHVGATLPARFGDAFGFLARAFDPPGPDASLAQTHAMIDNLRKRAGLGPRS